MANKGGRPTNLIWQHFLSVIKDGKKVAKCSSCGHEMITPKPERMKKHWEKCKAAEVVDGEQVNTYTSTQFEEFIPPL